MRIWKGNLLIYDKTYSLAQPILPLIQTPHDQMWASLRSQTSECSHTECFVVHG